MSKTLKGEGVLYHHQKLISNLTLHNYSTFISSPFSFLSLYISFSRWFLLKTFLALSKFVYCLSITSRTIGNSDTNALAITISIMIKALITFFVLIV